MCGRTDRNDATDSIIPSVPVRLFFVDDDGARDAMTAARWIGLTSVMAALLVASALFDAQIAAAAARLPPVVIASAHQISVIRPFAVLAGSGVVVLAITGGRVLTSRKRSLVLELAVERAAFIFAAIATAYLLAEVTKRLVGRARPALMDAFGPYHFDLLSMKSSLASFPSIHAATAFAGAVALALMLPRWRVGLCSAAALVSAARVLSNIQYASDVVAGAALGIVVTLLLGRLFAHWSLTFEDEAGSLRLKGPGLLSATLMGRVVSS